jgi:hypothetical protein
MESNHLPPPHLIMATGLQPAMGNKLQKLSHTLSNVSYKTNCLAMLQRIRQKNTCTTICFIRYHFTHSSYRLELTIR